MDDWKVGTIVLGYDGSEGAERAARLAASLARSNGARVVVVTTYHWSYSLDAMGEKADRVADEARAVAQRMVAELRSAGIEAADKVVDGQAGEALLQAAKDGGADLIVVGRRGHGAMASLLLGSTSEYVVRRATAPVLVAH